MAWLVRLDGNFKMVMDSICGRIFFGDFTNSTDALQFFHIFKVCWVVAHNLLNVACSIWL